MSSAKRVIPAPVSTKAGLVMLPKHSINRRSVVKLNIAGSCRVVVGIPSPDVQVGSIVRKWVLRWRSVDTLGMSASVSSAGESKICHHFD